jgi:hypothetical protein
MKTRRWCYLARPACMLELGCYANDLCLIAFGGLDKVITKHMENTAHIELFTWKFLTVTYIVVAGLSVFNNRHG